MDASDPFDSTDVDAAGSAPGDSEAARAAAASLHKRTYQACLPCRRRKVRCDLGSVDEPGDPPCLRCRREKKDCIFSETRRKRKADEEGGDLDPEFIARNKRSSIGLGGTTATSNDGFGDAHGIGGIHVDEGSDSRNMTPLNGEREEGTDAGSKKEATNKNRDVANETAAALFRQPITQPGDALRMLVDAASHTETESRKDSVHAAGGGAGSQTAGTHIRSGSMGTNARRGDSSNPVIDPQIMAMEEETVAGAAVSHTPPDLAAAIQVWSTLRFVQAGWFTAREAIGYIDYFYEHLAPLTPISPPDFREYPSHAKLLAEEPMLTVTMLTITSRYMKLQGPGGVTRTARIHDKLWEYLQGMITRMFWSQEQFGGGFCGAGAVKSVGDPEIRKRGLRSLGTVESLLLLSDWLPRSMHFPPGDDANELTVPLLGTMDAEIFEEQHNAHSGWTEPAIRSDRMVWSLVGMAYTLSWELGVFDSLVESGQWSPGPQEKTSYDPERADRIGRMLLVYVSQACGRLGYPNMMPGQGNETNFNFLKMDVPPGSFPGPYPVISAEDRIQRAWAELTALMRQSNTEMFESKQRTHESIENGSYVQFLEAWGPRLRDWKSRFDQTEMAPKARTILTIEYEYTRTYIHSLALQAVVESVTSTDEALVSGPQSAHTPPALISSKLVDIHKRNRVYIEELIDAARAVLRLSVTDLLPSGALHHSPVRTHFRILSAAMFLLKSFTLGAKESEVQISMALLDRTVAALRKSVIDDVHLSLRIAELLNGLTTTIRRKFHRLSVPSRSGKRGGPAGRSSTSAPKVGSGHDRKGSAIKHAHRTSSAQQQNGSSNAAVYSPSSAFPLPSSGDDFYSMLAGADLAPTLVDLKDSSISIMPPPDFMGQFNTDGYPPVSPHSAGDGQHPSPGALSSPTAAVGVGGAARPGTAGRTTSRGTSQGQVFSPTTTAGGATQPFSPMSTNSGGGDYNWVALDFNPLLHQQQGGLYNNHGNPHSPNPQTQQHQSGANGGFGATKKEDGQGQDAEMDDDAHDPGREAWMSGAFGPEISEGLEMLDAWGALRFDENGFGGVGNGGGW